MRTNHQSPFGFVLIVGLLVGVSPRAAMSYGLDTHYGLTYCMARAIGFTPLQAQRIGSACAAVDSDKNPDVAPVEMSDALDEANQTNRIQFHAFLDELSYPNLRDVPADYTSALQKRAARAAYLRDYCRSRMGNPGVYLHFLQDEFAHWGYGSKWGHYDPADAVLPGRLPFGSRTDFLSYDPVVDRPKTALRFRIPPHRNLAMLRESLACLRTFYRGPSSPVEVARQDKSCVELLDRLGNVNPISRKPGDFKRGPDTVKAYRVVDSWLSQNGAIERLPPPLFYRLTTDKAKDIIVTGPSQDDLSLYGTLHLELSPSVPIGAKVSVHLPPTMRGEHERLIGSRPALRNSPTLSFPDCPVGIVRVNYRDRSGALVSQTITMAGKNASLLLGAKTRLARQFRETFRLRGLEFDIALSQNMEGFVSLTASDFTAMSLTPFRRTHPFLGRPVVFWLWLGSFVFASAFGDLFHSPNCPDNIVHLLAAHQGGKSVAAPNGAALSDSQDCVACLSRCVALAIVTIAPVQCLMRESLAIFGDRQPVFTDSSTLASAARGPPVGR